MEKLELNLKSNKKIFILPVNLVLISFISLISIGTILLILPIASKSKGAISFIDALFTATSATCVTGLIVYDTQTTFTLFGQIVILFLIQIGGLGLIVFATFFTSIIGEKLGIKGKVLNNESLNYSSFSNIKVLLKKVILMVLFIEVVGAILLSLSFAKEFGIKSIYMGIFHSISAFCNAGFDLMGDFNSLMAYKINYFTVSIFAILVIIGGLGFLVLYDISKNRKNLSKIILHTKIVLIMTAFLLISGMILFFVFEYHNSETLKDYSIISKLFNSFFQSVTTRTAGFSTFSQDTSSDISKVLTIFLMFIGAAPGSTAGGVKITTIGILIAVVFCQIKRNDQINMFDKEISHSNVFRSISIVILSIIWIFVVSSILLIFEDISFLDSLFETTSAFGTVGLTTGLMPNLHIASKILIILTMFIGRIGPLTFAISIVFGRNDKNANIVFPEGEIMVG